MNSPTPNPEDSFEAELGNFRRAELPAEWRDDLLSKALPESDQDQGESTRRYFTGGECTMACAIALIWVGILGLRLTEPSAEPVYTQSQTTSSNSIARNSAQISSGSFPMLAWRKPHNPELESLLNP